MAGTVLGMGESARNKPGKILALAKLAFSRCQETKMTGRERKENNMVEFLAGP